MDKKKLREGAEEMSALEVALLRTVRESGADPILAIAGLSHLAATLLASCMVHKMLPPNAVEEFMNAFTKTYERTIKDMQGRK